MINARTIFGPLGASLLAILIPAVVVLGQVPGLFRVATAASLDEEKVRDTIDLRIAEHDERATLDESRFKGRSVFFEPPRPTPPPPVVRTIVDQADTGPRDARMTYGGVKPVNILGDEVWFAADAKKKVTHKIRLGETSGEVTVVDINAPWSVTLIWEEAGAKPKEYEVSLFNTSGAGFASQPKPTRSTIPGMTTVEVETDPLPDLLTAEQVSVMTRQDVQTAYEVRAAAMERPDLTEEQSEELRVQMQLLGDHLQTLGRGTDEGGNDESTDEGGNDESTDEGGNDESTDDDERARNDDQDDQE